MKNSKLSLMKYSSKEKESNNKLKLFKTNWPVSISKWKWDSINLIQIKETSIKDSWMKTMILWPNTVESKIKWKIFLVNLQILKINLKWTVKNSKVNFLKNKSLIWKLKNLIIKSNLTKLISHCQRQEIVSSIEWKKITL